MIIDYSGNRAIRSADILSVSLTLLEASGGNGALTYGRKELFDSIQDEFGDCHCQEVIDNHTNNNTSAKHIEDKFRRKFLDNDIGISGCIRNRKGQQERHEGQEKRENRIFDKK